MQREDEAKPAERTVDLEEVAPWSWTDSDDALIFWMLSLTPTQRLEMLQGFVDSVQALRDGTQA
jgi:hypothetical protein